MINKVLNRMKESKTFENRDSYNGCTYHFDDTLQIDSYNGLYRIKFAGEILGYVHSDNENHDKISDVIRMHKDKKKQRAIDAL